MTSDIESWSEGYVFFWCVWAFILCEFLMWIYNSYRRMLGH